MVRRWPHWSTTKRLHPLFQKFDTEYGWAGSLFSPEADSITDLDSMIEDARKLMPDEELDPEDYAEEEEEECVVDDQDGSEDADSSKDDDGKWPQVCWCTFRIVL